MGFFTKLVGDAVKKTITLKYGNKIAEAGIKTCDNLKEKIETKAEEKVDSFLNSDLSHSHLILDQKRYTFKESFNVYDENKNIKYVVKGKLLSSTHKLAVYNNNGAKIGEVNEKKFAIRSPFSIESKPKDFVVKLYNKKIGTIKSKFSFGKSKFQFDFNGWKIDGNFIGSNYKVKDDKGTIMEVSIKFLFGTDPYFIDIFNPEDELLCLMVALAIDSSHTTKSEDNKAARKEFKRKTRLF